ncbi:MAG: hypothetical protein WC570_00395 [Patescibacteria group bacterium]
MISDHGSLVEGDFGPRASDVDFFGCSQYNYSFPVIEKTLK